MENEVDEEEGVYARWRREPGDNEDDASDGETGTETRSG